MGEYPQFLLMRDAVKDDAELIAISGVDSVDLTFSSDEEMERAHRQFVSGWMFGSFGLKPALGRLLTQSDDLKPKAHPFAVLSYDYWSQRFGGDRNVIGRKFQMGNDVYEIVGIAPQGFTVIRLSLPADLRVLAFVILVSAGATLLFGLLPALRASSTNPAVPMKRSDNPRSRRSLMYGLIGTQVAFCFVIHFAADGFVTTWQRLSHQPTGFSSDRVLTLETVAKHPQPVEFWFQAADHLRDLNGVESVAPADVPLLDDSTSNGFVATDGKVPSPILALFLGVCPGWLQTMKIPLLEGRDLRRNDTAPGNAMVKRKLCVSA